MSERNEQNQMEMIKTLQQQNNAFEIGLAQPQAEPPATFVIECNKTLAQDDGDALRTNAWTNNFPPIKLKKGDVVSVNSAFLSSRGSGDLLQFDNTNNKTRVLFEYYASNDNTTNKRPQYNYKGLPLTYPPYKPTTKTTKTKHPDTTTTIPECFANTYPVNYKPARLHRLAKTYKTPPDFNPVPAPPFPAETTPQAVEPFKTEKDETFWGEKDAKTFIVDKEEDKYIAGLIREPQLKIAETRIFASKKYSYPTFQSPEAYGVVLGNLRIWYVSTPLSKVGKCSDNATMRIYFMWGKSSGAFAGSDPYYLRAVQNTYELLQQLRVGEYIQFKNMENVAGYNANGSETSGYIHYKSTDATPMIVGGSNCFYCSGYASKNEGITINGNVVDRYDQVGKEPISINGNPTFNNDASFINPLGMFMKIVRVNAGIDAHNSAQAPHAPTDTPVEVGYAPPLAIYSDDFMNTLPFIEVQARRAVSLCWGNPNTENSTTGIPTMSVPLNFNDLSRWNSFVSPHYGINLRTWYMGANQTIQHTDKGTLDGSTENNLQRSKQGIDWNDAYPVSDIENDPTNKGKLNEKMYFCARPYRFSPNIGLPTEAEANRTTSYQMNLVEENLLPTLRSGEHFMSMTGLATGINEGSNSGNVGTIVQHNYNFRTMNGEGIEQSPNDANGPKRLDYVMPTGVNGIEYAGGRLPMNWKSGNELNKYDDSNYSTATRIGSHNQGQDYYCNLPPAYGGTGFDNIADTDGYRAILREADSICDNKIPLAQQTLNPNTNLYLENQHGTGIFFYFAHNINNTSEFTQQNFLGTTFPTSKANKPTDMASGCLNYVVGAKGLPVSYYQHQNSANGQPIIRDKTGLWYGFASADRLTNNVPEYGLNDVLDNGIYDFCNVLSQMPNLTYARFTNADGESEVMFIQILPRRIQTINGQSSHSIPDLDAGASTTLHTPYLDIANVPNFTDETNNAPAFVIIQRNCDGKGLKLFKGSEDGNTFPVAPLVNNADNYYSPFILQKHQALLKNKGNYFEILNSYANMEHEFKVDNLGRELLPIGYSTMNENLSFKENVGQIGDNSILQRYGKACGADFYWAKFPNMPYVEDGTNIIRMTDNMIRISDTLVRIGEPTLAPNIDIDRIDNVAHNGRMSWIPHLDFIELDLPSDKNYFSPTDVASFITKKFHTPHDLYKTWDTALNTCGGRFPSGQFANTAGKYPLNSVFRVIHAPSHTQTQGQSTLDKNDFDSATGMIRGAYHEGDFTFFIDMPQEIISNSIYAYHYCGGQLLGLSNSWDSDSEIKDLYYTIPPSGQYTIFPPNNDSVVNTLPSTDRYQVACYGVNQRVENQVQTFYTDPSVNLKAFDDDLKQRYNKTETFGSIYAGTNNAQLAFNTDVSRFEWKFLHQPLYSEFKTDVNGVPSGGNIVAKIWTQSINGVDNWDRVGGINVVNWCLDNFNTQFGTTTARRNTGYKDVRIFTADTDNIGNNFMNKLGFSNTWISDNSGSEDDPECALMSMTAVYKPKGTTRSDYDVSQSKPYTQSAGIKSFTPSRFRKAYPDLPADGSGDLDLFVVDNTNTTIQGAKLTDYNQPATAKQDEFKPPDELTSHLGYGLVGNQSTPPSIKFNKTLDADGNRTPTDLNVDDIKFPNYEVEVDSNALTADELPKKTNIGYFLIMSDIIDKNEFIGSANNGGNLKCIGILSKNYENNDFFFSFQSPVEFYVKQDRTITQIKTEIKTPTLEDPIGLDYNSSIIYTIVRAENIPEPDVPPIALQQALDYNTMEQLSGMMGIDYSTSLGAGVASASGVEGSGLNQLRQNIVSAVLFPNQNSASTIYANQTAMGRYVNRLPVSARMRAINGSGGSGINTPNLEQLHVEGLGVAEPLALEPSDPISDNLSQENVLQLTELQEASRQGGKKPPPSDSGASDEGSLVAEAPQNWWAMENNKDVFSADDISKTSERTKTLTRRSSSSEGKSAQELFGEASAVSRQKSPAEGALKSLTLTQFFGRWINHPERSMESIRNIQKQIVSSGFNPAEPKTWDDGHLNSWAGKNKRFDWSESAYRKIGGVINAEGQGKIRAEIMRRQALGKQKVMTAEERDPKTRSQGEKVQAVQGVIATQDIGEPLRYRIGRTQPDDPTSRKEKKVEVAKGFWDEQNPYDLRTWKHTTLRNYATIQHYNVPKDQRTKDSMLNTTAHRALNNEITRRSTGKRKLGIHPSKEYKNDKEKPEGYDAKSPHKTPHKNLGHDRHHTAHISGNFYKSKPQAPKPPNP